MNNHWAGKLTMVKIDKLKPHPALKRFPVLPDAKFQQIKSGMAKRGLDSPLQATSKFVLMDGRHRLRAAKELGWSEIQVLIREDLTGKSERDILRALFALNHERRQQSLLESVEVLLELRDDDPTLNMAEITGASDKQIRNLARIVRGPRELLAAVKAGASKGVSEAMAQDVLKINFQQQAQCLALIKKKGNVRQELRQLLAGFKMPRRKKSIPVEHQLLVIRQQAEALADTEVSLTTQQRSEFTEVINLLTAWLEAAPPQLVLKMKQPSQRA